MCLTELDINVASTKPKCTSPRFVCWFIAWTLVQKMAHQDRVDAFDWILIREVEEEGSHTVILIPSESGTGFRFGSSVVEKIQPKFFFVWLRVRVLDIAHDFDESTVIEGELVGEDYADVLLVIRAKLVSYLSR